MSDPLPPRAAAIRSGGRDAPAHQVSEAEGEQIARLALAGAKPGAARP